MSNNHLTHQHPLLCEWETFSRWVSPILITPSLVSSPVILGGITLWVADILPPTCDGRELDRSCFADFISTVNTPMVLCSWKFDDGFDGSSGGVKHKAQMIPTVEDSMFNFPEFSHVVTFDNCNCAVKVSEVIFEERTETRGPSYIAGSTPSALTTN